MLLALIIAIPFQLMCAIAMWWVRKKVAEYEVAIARRFQFEPLIIRRETIVNVAQDCLGELQQTPMPYVFKQMVTILRAQMSARRDALPPTYSY